MKKVLVLIFLIQLGIPGFCQTGNSSLKKMYVEIGGGGSSQNGIFSHMGVKAVWKKNWISGISYHSINMNPKSLPDDYRSGYTVLIFFPIPDEFPSAKMNLISFTGGKLFELRRNIWFTAEAGLSIVKGEHLTFTPQSIEDNGFFYTPSNYAVSKQDKTSLGGMVKADINWAFLPFAGLGAGAFANVNSLGSPVGFQVKLIVGWMNNKKKQ